MSIYRRSRLWALESKSCLDEGRHTLSPMYKSFPGVRVGAAHWKNKQITVAHTAVAPAEAYPTAGQTKKNVVGTIQSEVLTEISQLQVVQPNDPMNTVLQCMSSYQRLIR